MSTFIRQTHIEDRLNLINSKVRAGLEFIRHNKVGGDWGTLFTYHETMKFTEVCLFLDDETYFLVLSLV